MSKKYRVGIIGFAHPHINHVASMFAAHPQVEISLQSTESVVDFSRETQIVAALRIGLGQWPGVLSEHLFDEWLVPMASPARMSIPLPQPAIRHASSLARPNAWWRQAVRCRQGLPGR